MRCDFVGVAISLLLVSSQALANPPREAAPAASAARTLVLLAIVGQGEELARRTLASLMEGQLRGMGLSLVQAEPRGSVTEWANAAGKSNHVLLAILLDTKRGQGWRVVVVDAARGRAIARELPGGGEQDPASIEAVTSIVISAANALRDGLEVASAPVAVVVGAAPNPPAQVSAVKPEYREPKRRLVVFGTVGAAIATSATGPAPGATVALGLGWTDWLEARGFGTLLGPSTVHNELGEFQVHRAMLGAALGPVFSGFGFSFSPQVGLVGERLRRSRAVPAPGVFVNEASPLYRVGGLAQLRLRRSLAAPLSIELLAGAAYFGRSVQFSVRNQDSSPFLQIGPTTGFAHLALDITTE